MFTPTMTNQNATSRVDYGITSSLGATRSDGAHVMAHAVDIDWLHCERNYQFRIRSVSQTGVVAESGLLAFTAAECPHPGIGAAPQIDVWDGDAAAEACRTAPLTLEHGADQVVAQFVVGRTRGDERIHQFGDDLVNPNAPAGCDANFHMPSEGISNVRNEFGQLISGCWIACELCFDGREVGEHITGRPARACGA